MVTVDWIILAKGAAIDRDTSELSIFGVIPAITPVGLPLLLQQSVVVISLRRETGDPEILNANLRVLANEREMLSHPLDVDFQGRLNCHAVVTIHGLIVAEPGNMIFDFSAPNMSPAVCRVFVATPQVVAKPISD